MKLHPHAVKLLDLCLAASRLPLYLVGGYLRDNLIGRESRDLDLVCLDRPESLCKAVASKLSATWFPLNQETRVYRIVIPPWQIDIAKIRGNSIQEDLEKRDFTINALALPVLPGLKKGAEGILDCFSGLKDLRGRRVRAISEKGFTEDPLRLLRAFRIAAELDFKIERRSLRFISRHAHTIRNSAGERIREELLKLLDTPSSASWLAAMDDSGLLTAIFPEIESSRKCAKVYHGEGGVLGHSIETVKRLEFLLSHLDRIYPDFAGRIRKHLQDHPGRFAPSVLKLATLLHDIAKPSKARMIDGRLRFFGHDKEGSRMVRSCLKELRFSQAEIQMACAIVRHHLRPGNLAANRVITNRAAYRFFRDLKGHGISVLLACWADHASYVMQNRLLKIINRLKSNIHGTEEKTLNYLRAISFLLEQYFARKERVKPPPLVDGHDVMKLLSIPPGPQVGKVLEKVREAQAEGKISIREEALENIRRTRLKQKLH